MARQGPSRKTAKVLTEVVGKKLAVEGLAVGLCALENDGKRVETVTIQRHHLRQVVALRTLRQAMPQLFFAAGQDARPHVTLTFAQSADGKIAGPGKKQLALSCKESMLMTHRLRTKHDGILVGIGTVLNDDPQLNARLLPVPPPVARLPRPVVLDSALRMPATCKLIRNYANDTGRQPLLLCCKTASADNQLALEEAGAEVVRLDGTSLDWPSVLSQVQAAGVQRLMVEGGAAVIASLLQEQQLIDTLLVTVAPIEVGTGGLGYSASLPGDNDPTSWSVCSTEHIGIDTVIIWHKNGDASFQTEI